MKYILLFLLWTSNASAITEEDVAKSVLKHFPLIEQSELKLLARKAEVTAAEGAFDTKLTFKSRNRIEEKYDNAFFETTLEKRTPFHGLALIAGHRQGLGHFPAYDGKYETSGAGEIFAGIALPLLRNFQTDEFRTNLLLAKLQKNISKAEVQVKKNVYVHKALSLYYKWLVINQKLKIREEILQVAKERQEMLEKRFKAGDLEKIKLIDNERSILKRQEELAKTKIEWQEVVRELGLYFIEEEGKPADIGTETFPASTVPKLAGALLNPVPLPQLSIIDQELEMQESKRRLYSQSRLPGLQLELIGAKELSPNEPYDPERLQIGLKFELPLENRKARGNTVAAEYKLKALMKQKEYFMLEIKRRIEFALEAAKISRARWEITTSEFEKTVAVAKAERIKWRQGASDLYIVTLREQDAADADIKRWSSWLDYHIYLLDQRLYSGMIIPQALETGAI